ncbi:MAG: cytochrome c3 family protein [Sulfuricella sp.]|nr:cytochrome c3 family protein [Sulfuricella sp.]
MAQIFQPQSVLLLKIGAGAVVLGVVALVLIWRESIAQRPPVDAPVEQVPPFSHKHHVGDVGLDCRFCHASVETSAFAGIPPTSTCMTCHSQLFTDQAMLSPLAASLRENRPLRWKRVHRLPDFVYFNHGIHVAKGVGCSTCHGPVERMPLMWRVQSLEMKWCLACHRAPENFVRPRERVFDMGWRPPQDQAAQGKKLLGAYRIDAKRLADCSNCHR